MPVQTIDKLAMLRLEVSIWSARARLTTADLKDPSAMPPQAMATLGTKRLFDPTKMRIFNAIKARATTLLDRNGARFIGGWATDIDKLQNIENELTTLANEFNTKVNEFFATYDTDIDAWVAQFPEYERVLRNAVPTKAQLQRKFCFNWQTFQITPTMTYAEANNTNDAIAALDNTAMEEVAKVISDIYNETFLGKEKVGKKSFRPFRFLSSKLQALAFIHPYFSSLDALLSGVINGYQDKCDDPNMCATFKALLASLTTADGVRAIVQPFMDNNQTTDELMDGFIEAKYKAKEDTPCPAVTVTAAELFGDDTLAAIPSPFDNEVKDSAPNPLEMMQRELAVTKAEVDEQTEKLINLSKSVLNTAQAAITSAQEEVKAELEVAAATAEPSVSDEGLDSGGLW